MYTPIKNVFTLPLTSKKHYNPNDATVYVIKNNLTFIKLTHELLDMLAFCKIKLKNKYVDNLLKKFSEKNSNIFIIVDCYNEYMSKKYEIKKLFFSDKNKNKNQILYYHTILNINGNKIIDISNGCMKIYSILITLKV